MHATINVSGVRRVEQADGRMLVLQLLLLLAALLDHETRSRAGLDHVFREDRAERWLGSLHMVLLPKK